MNKEKVKTLLKKIKGAYPKFEANEMTLEVWSDVLKNSDEKEVNNKLINHIKNSRFEPMVSDIFPKKDYRADDDPAFVPAEPPTMF